jgi:glycogen debranching enzyme
MRAVFSGVVMLCGVAAAQTAALRPVDAFSMKEDGLAIRRHVEAGKPFTVAGARGVMPGQQEGTFEAWVLPVKLLSNFTIRANVEGYSVPIDLNADAAEIEVFPDHTVITYSHIAFTVRQIMFAPDDAEDGTGAVVLFQIDSTRPMDLTFSFTPEMRPMWPQRSQGLPSADWVKQDSGGFYLLHTDFPNLAGAVGMPDTQPGIMAPYQEKPHFYPLQLNLHYDPKRDTNRYFPLLMAVGTTAETATNATLQEKLNRLDATLPQIYAKHAARYELMKDTLTAIRTPDAGFDDDFAWAEMSIEQLKTRAQPSGEMGLVAGYYSSGDSARPGFGWYFGRDTLYTLYAVNGFGDFALTREALEFLMKRQRDDGKIMHEYPQTAAFFDWKEFSYAYAAADSTPLFLTAMLDYVRSSGDIAYLKQHREVVEKAWHFETTHDSDGDGIYDNSQGTGWVESWPTGMPHQEIYLALLDQQASAAMSKLAALLDDKATANAAETRANDLTKKIEAEYYDSAQQQYAFSRNTDGTLDRTATVYPAIAWWNGGQGLAHPQASFRRWASHDFATDWGLRDVAESDPFYNPISYHQGSVWPLFTGWASIAEYRGGHALSGYTNLMQNADLTTAQDLGAVTELLSGAFFQPFGRSTSHQLWSSAMVITPALRGMFGVDVDGLAGSVRLDPHLPADWDKAEVQKLHVGQSVCSLNYQRQGQSLIVKIATVSGPAVRLATAVKDARTAPDGLSIAFALPPVEVAVPHGLPLPGARTSQMKVLEETATAHSLKLELEADAGSVVELKLRRNATKLDVHADGAELVPAEHGSGAGSLDSLTVKFPSGAGYQQQTVTLQW